MIAAIRPPFPVGPDGTSAGRADEPVMGRAGRAPIRSRSNRPLMQRRAPRAVDGSASGHEVWSKTGQAAGEHLRITSLPVEKSSTPEIPVPLGSALRLLGTPSETGGGSVHRDAAMDRHQAQGARRGRLQTLDLPGVRDRLRDPPEDPSPRRAARLPGGITQVKEAVARYRRHHAELFVPLSHPPGEAQFDFGFATVKIAGIERKAACAVMCLPYSDAFLVQAYPRECTETFQAAHTAAFSFFGGVPTKISYDNTSIAVRKI